ncbi:sterile alpha motif domain-containing protein 10 [Platysternon megacephalum]|uniref:Sterile alpha motif domain-containing protein 10 n=1 Tax=Platysternon megacephalum TaxID=55544 RepID=A0A4D9DNI7_9SAUR|nr:sterile alpha motif domain-containing protein 10 [Platysternon megacephalum]
MRGVTQPGGITGKPELSTLQYGKVNAGTVVGIVFGPERKLQEVDGLIIGSSTKDGPFFGVEGSGFGPQSEEATGTEDSGSKVDVVDGAEGRGCLGIDLACISTICRSCLFIST